AGRVGETYNIGGCNERTNLEVVQAICGYLTSWHRAVLRIIGSSRSLRIGPVTTSAMPLTPAKMRASLAGDRRKASRAACAGRSSGTLPTSPGGDRFWRVAIAASA